MMVVTTKKVKKGWMIPRGNDDDDNPNIGPNTGKELDMSLNP